MLRKYVNIEHEKLTRFSTSDPGKLLYTFEDDTIDGLYDDSRIEQTLVRKNEGHWMKY